MPTTWRSAIGRYIALPSLLFEKFAERLRQDVPELRLQSTAYSDFLVYPLTGGFSSWSLLPAFAVGSLYRLESVLFAGTARRITGVRVMAVYERIASQETLAA